MHLVQRDGLQKITGLIVYFIEIKINMQLNKSDDRYFCKVQCCSD